MSLLSKSRPFCQVWLCGGSMEVLPCSRVAHIARMKKPYHSNIAFHMRRNALRVAEVWMDEYKSNVYLAWNIPMEVRNWLFRSHFANPLQLLQETARHVVSFCLPLSSRRITALIMEIFLKELS